jgi:hypothetical protein
VSVVTCGYETLSVKFRAVHISHVFQNYLDIKSSNKVRNLGHYIVIRNPMNVTGHLKAVVESTVMLDTATLLS